jgi:ABC-2 type transport system permease protein
MSTPTDQHEVAAPAGIRVTQWRVIVSEWTKFRSLKSTVWTLAIGIALTIGFGALFSAVTASQWKAGRQEIRQNFDAVSTSLNGIVFAQLAIGVLGVLFITGEYSTGMIRSSLTAVPHRLPMLWGKVIVYVVFVGVLSIVATFLSFFLGQALLSSAGINVSISAPGAFRQVIGAGLYLAVAGVVGMGIGALVRNSAGGISAFVSLFFVLPIVVQLLPSSWTNHFAKYLPASAGEALWSVSRTGAETLSPWVGFAVLCLWAVALVGIAAMRLVRTDA